MKNRVILAIVLIAVGGLYLLLTRSNSVQNQTSKPPSLTQISSKNCSGNPTPQQAEGPYYKSGSPERINISQGVTGEPLTITGFVFDKDCKPVANAWLDFWQADKTGNYDNDGYTLRGYIFTDESGKYTVKTIIPAEYGSRPPHIHVKVRAGNGSILTSQLYFPQASQNQSDSIFNKDLVMEMSEDRNGKVGKFNFVLP